MFRSPLHELLLSFLAAAWFGTNVFKGSLENSKHLMLPSCNEFSIAPSANTLEMILMKPIKYNSSILKGYGVKAAETFRF